MSGRETDELLCTAGVNPYWPHRYEQTDTVTADPAITPGYDTCGRDAAGHAEYTPERIRDAEWGQACYQRAAENVVYRGVEMHVGHARQELVDQAHAEALRFDAAIDDQRRENRRRNELNQQIREGRNSDDPDVRARWRARDDAWTRAQRPADTDEF